METASTSDRTPADERRRAALSDDHAATILAVERDPHVRELLDHFLTQAGYVVHFADDGQAAFDRARKIRPDVVITALLLPGLDGLQLCSRLKQDPATHEASVVIFSVLAAAERARDAGADGFVIKPLSEERLVTVVRDLLTEHSSRRVEEDT